MKAAARTSSAIAATVGYEKLKQATVESSIALTGLATTIRAEATAFVEVKVDFEFQIAALNSYSFVIAKKTRDFAAAVAATSDKDSPSETS